MKNRKMFLSALAMAVLLVAGCGGGGNDGGLPPAPAGASAGPPYDASTATATISGSIMFEGTAPMMPRIQMAADPFCQGLDSGATSQEVLVTEDSKLQNVIVYVRSGHDEGLSYPVPTENVMIDQMGCGYIPHTLTMMVNQEMVIRNSDSTLHNIHAWAEINRPFNEGQAVQGMETTKTFTMPEMPLPVRCDVHRWMSSFVGVFDHPFHTTSGDTGDFGIDVPPGTYELVVWHEKYGEQVSTVAVADGETLELSFTFSEGAAD